MNRLAAATLAGLILALGAAGGAAAAATSLLNLESQFMCVSCHEPLELVASPQALAEKANLARMLAAGQSVSEIKRNMVAQYGVQVLGRPPASGFDLTVYIVPPAILIAGVGFLLYTLPRWRERSRRAAATPLAGAAGLPDEDTARLDAELERFI